MKKWIKGITIGTGALLLITTAAGFAYLPRFFEAKYDGVKITTPDGKQLVTIVRLPEGEGPFPTLVVRSPYTLPHTPLSGMPSEDFTDLPDSRLPEVGWKPVIDAGYAIVIQHTRGRVGSEGQVLDVKDREDALQLISWVKEQPWSNGKVGTTGDSIEAIMAMLANSEHNSKIDASFVQIGTPNLINEVIRGPGGALKLESFLPWTAEQIMTADNTHFNEMGYGPIKRRTSLIGMGLMAQDIRSELDEPHKVDLWKHLPLKDFPHFSEATIAWNGLLDSSADSDAAHYFDATKTTVPTYYVAAWFDVFAPSQLSSFERNEARGVDQRLLILNGTHFDPENPDVWPIKPMLPWFDYHLKGKTSEILELPRVVFPIANGNDEWYGTETWPPKAASPTNWYLHASGKASRKPRNGMGVKKRSFHYDPENPVPTIGGRNLLITNGPLDQAPVRQSYRNDVLSYDSEPLASNLVVAGHIYANITVSSDAPDTDFTVKIMDLAPDGVATLVTEGIQRARFRDGLNTEIFMNSDETYKLRIDLGHIAWRFTAGHRLAIDISSSNFPQWDRNLNTDDPLFSSTSRNIANNTVHHNQNRMSYIELPVVADLADLKRLDGVKTAQSE